MFRLRRVLEWKELLERRARVARVEVERRAGEIEDALGRLAETRASFPDAAGERTAVVEDLVAWSRFGEGLRRREALLRKRLEALEPEREQRVREHLEIRREVEGLRRLEERASEARRKRIERKMQEAIDDVAGRRKLPVTGTKFRELPAGMAGARGENAPEPRVPAGDGPNRGTVR